MASLKFVITVWQILLPMVLLVCHGTNGNEQLVRSQIISAVSDGVGGYKIVKGSPKHAILRANFTNKINSTGYVSKSD